MPFPECCDHGGLGLLFPGGLEGRAQLIRTNHFRRYSRWERSCEMGTRHSSARIKIHFGQRQWLRGVFRDSERVARKVTETQSTDGSLRPVCSAEATAWPPIPLYYFVKLSRLRVSSGHWHQFPESSLTSSPSPPLALVSSQ